MFFSRLIIAGRILRDKIHLVDHYSNEITESELLYIDNYVMLDSGLGVGDLEERSLLQSYGYYSNSNIYNIVYRIVIYKACA